MPLKFTLLILATLISMNAGAVELKPISEPKNDPLPVSPGQPPIPCDQIINQMVRYQQMVTSQQNSLTAFLGQVSEKVMTWYEQLSPLEGTPQTIVPGTFSPLLDAGEKIAKISDLAYDNTELLAEELERIVGSLRGCSIAPPAPSAK